MLPAHYELTLALVYASECKAKVLGQSIAKVQFANFKKNIHPVLTWCVYQV